MLSIPVGHLLSGSAITGVVFGIAARRSLRNAFIGMVLLLARLVSVPSNEGMLSPELVLAGAVGPSGSSTAVRSATALHMRGVDGRCEHGPVFTAEPAKSRRSPRASGEW